MIEVLSSAKARGFVGPGPLEHHIEQALGFANLVPMPPRTCLDLGSGGGIPGLPLALLWPDSRWYLLESRGTRATFLSWAIETLGLCGRVSVLHQRAEEAGRGHLRASLDLVVSRGFGKPAVTAECAAPFLRLGGVAVVSEPPGGARGRWPKAGLALLGLAPSQSASATFSYQLLSQVAPCPNRFPRRVGLPAKRPLF